MLVIGLTGGIGAGKTTVANLFAKRGVPLIDADIIARELSRAGEPAFKIMQTHFGDDILSADGQLDRKKLRSIIFNNAQERKWLEQLLHPRIREEIVKQLNRLSSLYCIVIIPLLVEVKAFPFINRILVVDAPVTAQIDRIKTRDNHNESEIRNILASQSLPEERLAIADDVITNDGNLEDLALEVDRLHQFYTALALK